MYIGGTLSPARNTVMVDQKYDEMMARYLADMEKESRRRLAEAADLIAKFMALAASKGVILGAKSFEYIQTTGIVAKVPGIARALLGPIRVVRDGLLPFNEIASRFPVAGEASWTRETNIQESRLPSGVFRAELGKLGCLVGGIEKYAFLVNAKSA